MGLFDKRKVLHCIHCKGLVDECNVKKWHDVELMYPIQAITGKELSEIVKDSVLSVDMDGMGGADRNEIVRVVVVDPKLVLCKPGIALSVIKPSSSSSSNKRKGQAGDENMEPTQKQAKTKDIRKIQNSSTSSLKCSDVVVGTNLQLAEEGKANEEEEEEQPDNLNFNERTVGLLVQEMNTFQKSMLQFCSYSSKQAAETNKHLSNLNKKMENNSVKLNSSSSFSKSSLSSPPNSSIFDSPLLDAVGALNGDDALNGDLALNGDGALNGGKTKVVVEKKSVSASYLTNNSYLANTLLSAMPGIRLITSATRVSSNAPTVVLNGQAPAVVSNGQLPQVGPPVGPPVGPQEPPVDNGDGDDSDDGDLGEVERWDARYDYDYKQFKLKFDALLHEKIPRQFQHLNFKQMRAVTHVNLSGTLNDIDSMYFWN